MSRENVDTAKRGIDAYNARDADALIEVTSPDFEWLPALPGTVEGHGYRGREGIETYLAEARETWEAQRLTADEFRDLGDRVVMLGRAKGWGRTSGIQVDTPLAIVFDFRGTKMVRAHSYLDHGDALKAVGLED